MRRFAQAYANSLPGDPAPEVEGPALMGQFPSTAAIRQFMLAGDATITIKSLTSGLHFTYRIQRADEKPGDRNPAPWFVKLLVNGEDWLYLGMLSDWQGKVGFRLTSKSAHAQDAKTVKAFTFAWAHIQTDRLPAGLEIRHEGRCGRCNRALTHPESLDLGIGPECAGKMGLR